MQVNKFTRNLMAKFPSWMKMAKDPESIGAQFLDVFGVTFQDFEDEMNEAVRNFYITTANTEIIDWIYKVPLINEEVVDSTGHLDIQEVYILDEEGNQTNVNRSPHVQNFYHRNAKKPNYWLDRANETIYLRMDLDEVVDLDHPFKSLVINGSPHYTLFLHQVWNMFDEFGLLVGLKRHYKETNLFFKERILDVFRNPGATNRTGLQAGIERELGLEPGIVKIKNFDNIEQDDSLMYTDGQPTRKLMEYAKKVNETLKYSWDEMNLDQAYWFSISQENIAIDYLPHIWDIETDKFKKEDFQSGVGFGEDLYVHKPYEQDRHRPVKVSIGLMGYVDDYEEIHPEITFKYKIYAKGKIIDKEYQPQDFKYTIEAAENFEQPYRIHARSDVYDEYLIPMRNVFDIAKETTAPNINFGKSTDILHDQTDEMVKLIVRPKSFNDNEAPNLEYLELVWQDTEGKEHTYRFDSSNDFFIDAFNKHGNPTTNVLTSALAFQDGKGLTLGKGVFQDSIDTSEEFRTGTWDTNNLVIEEGSLKLNLGALFSKGDFGPK